VRCLLADAPARSQTKGIVAEWAYSHLRSYGFLRQVAWFEAGRSCPGGAGIFCFSCPDAETLFERLDELAGLREDAPRRR